MQRQPSILFWDVDTQVDFMHPDGALYVGGAEKITSNLARLTAAARQQRIPVIASADDHRLGDAEISESPDFETTWPPHCMHGTPGQRKIRETSLPEALVIGRDEISDTEIRRHVNTAGEALLILKDQVDVFGNPNTAKLLAEIEPRRIVLYGVALDVCNRHTVDGLWNRGFTKVAVVADAVMAIDEERGNRLLDEWDGRGLEILTTDEVLARVEEPAYA
ncbi:MAG TPA: isochorismatase family cysteine hydrolase [Thermoanaerobaculia bacterium]|nr:isochorismatase family cysteine hydrolase [Thermoanaerobaculia bacterium]